MTELLVNGFTGLFLFINGYLDWKKREISLVSLPVFGAAGIGLNIGLQYQTFAELLGGMGIGGFLILIAFLTREAVGVGDGLLLMVMGIFLGFWETLTVLAAGLILCTCVTGLRILLHKIEKEERIPLVPFLLLAFLGGLIF